jgi:ribonuclease HI
MRTFFCDGGCFGNGTGDAYAYGSFGELSGGVRTLRFAFAEANTNNQAEYQALIHLLRELIPIKESVEIRMDSQLVVNQCAPLGKAWKCKDKNLIRLRDEARELINQRRKHGTFLKWVRRDEIVEVLGH